MLCALAFLICLDACGKWLGMQGVPVAASTWSRYLGHVLLVIVLFAPKRGRELFVTGHPLRQAVRGTLMMVVTLLYFAALKLMPLAQSTAIFFLTPILVTLFSTVFLREHASWATWLSVCCGFLGVLIVIRPGSDLPLLGVLLVLAAAVGNASYQTLTRAQAQADQPEVQLLYSALVGAVIMTAAMPFWWTGLSLTPLQWLVFASLGILGGLGHLLLIRAFQAAAAPVLTPWMYTQLLLSLAIGYLVFGDSPDTIAMIGIAIIAVSPHLTRLQRRVRQAFS